MEDKIILYLHGLNAGKKLALIKKNNKVGFQMSCSHKLLLGEKPCNSTMEYESVCGNGIVEILNEAEKEEALIYLVKQYNDNEKHEFNKNEINAVLVFKLTVSEAHGKVLKCS